MNDHAISRDTIVSKVEDEDKSGPYLKTKLVIDRVEYRMNPDFPDDSKCDCGHAYYRHFDPYEDWDPVGCKYCHCGMWHPPVQKAGMIPYIMENNNITMMFMVSSDPNFGGPYPQISKGNVDPTDEGSKDGAFREAQEELGLRESNIVHAHHGIHLIYKGHIDGQNDSKYTFALYACEVKDRIDFDTPHYETGEIQWMTAKEFQTRGRPEHRELVKEAFVKIALYHGYQNDKRFDSEFDSDSHNEVG